MLPSIFTGLNNIVNASNPTKILYEAISYKPFLSLFNMTGLPAQNSDLAGVGMFFSLAFTHPTGF